MIFKVVIGEDASMATEVWITPSESISNAVKVAENRCYKGWTVLSVERSNITRVINDEEKRSSR